MSQTKVIEQKISSALILLASLNDKVAEIKELLSKENTAFNPTTQIIMPVGFEVISSEDFD